MNTSLRLRTVGARISPFLLLLLFGALMSAGPRSASAAPILRIDTAHRVFDSTKVRIGRTAYDTIRVTNAGTAGLRIDSVIISGATANLYTVLHKPDTLLAAGASDYIAVAFSPVTLGTFRDSLTIFSNGGTAGRTLTGIGVAPSISLSTTTVNIDTVIIGLQSCRPIDITNTGTDTLAITSNTLTSTSGGFYYYALTGRDTLIAPGRTATIGVCFLPTVQGRDTAYIAIKPDIPGDTVTRYIVVTGTGVHLSALSSTPLTISTAVIGMSTCTTDTLRISGGTNPVIIKSLRVTGADSASVTLTTPSLPDTLRTDTSFAYTICVNPTHRGPLNASITVNFTSLGLQQTVTVPLNITGQLVCASVSPTTLFQNRTVLGRTDTAQLTITNCGDVATTYNASVISGSSAYRILGTGTSATVQPNASATFTVVYTPTSVLVDTGAIRVTGGTGVTPMIVPLLGSGGTVIITALDTISDVPVGTCKDFNVRITNTGNMTWTSGIAQVIGTNAGDFTVKNATSVTLAPDSSANMTVTFCPKSIATETATITFPGASPNVLTQITLIGRGVVNAVGDEASKPTLAINSVFPNPSASSVTINFGTADVSDVRMQLVDSRGALVMLAVNGRMNGGTHEVSLDTKALANGTYFVMLSANGQQVVKQLTVLH